MKSTWFDLMKLFLIIFQFLRNLKVLTWIINRTENINENRVDRAKWE
jgi:hypothetical protein